MIARRALLLVALATSVMLSAPAFAQDMTRLNPNTATAEELATVPGLSAELASDIEANRPFATIVEFNTLLRETLSEDEANTLFEALFVPINLNTASRDAIALIPGMSRRMIREFEEYRPYPDLATFDREIGKYVEDAEVARLRSYVTL